MRCCLTLFNGLYLGNQVYTFENDLSREDELRPQTDYPPVTQVAILESAEMLKKYSSGAYDLNELNKFEDHPPLASDTKSLHRDQKSKVGGESGHLNMYGVWLHVSIVIYVAKTPLFCCYLRSTSFILMQGVPPAINVKRLHQELRNIEGVSNVHELHVWQLSDTKTVASVHLHIQRPKLSKLKANANSKSSTDISKIYMTVAKQANDILHRYGVHSTTIQPEFLFAEFFGDDISSASENAGYLDLNNQKRGDSRKISAKSTIGGASIKSVLQNIDTSAQACLLRCQDGACAASECCDFLASDSEDHHAH
ncbi:Zinc transporter 1 [Zancudomyces culisetae]|uniref:Zinc transporter 1 n=1 Tax=Zancudomyces culisetae TaxID=1213189 RepID=A0A1R1PRX5_ZANCU|nr:Zinc transporter 1 [Zancudomyces culisetae]|eukprot:OMH83701.1 Zinc transporter 1 [Zancudomyces culisetae]